MQTTESSERWAWTTVGSVLILFLVGPAVRSPDGLEMLRLTARWLGQPVSVGDPAFWPPLWSALNIPSVALGFSVSGARLLNLLLWGLLIWPLHHLSADLGGRVAARRAVVFYLVLPMLTLFASVLDARALGAFIATSFAAAAVSYAKRRRGLAVLLLFASLATLARPEGIMFPFIAGVITWMVSRAWWRGLAALVLTLLPSAIIRSTVRGVTGHEQLFAPWYGTWSTWDMLALFGPASVPTEFRRFALAAVESGVINSRPALEDVAGVLMAVPGGIAEAAATLAGAIGIVGLVLAGRGLARVVPENQRWLTVGLVVLPFLAIAGAPMAKDQAGPLSNFLFLMPVLVVLAAVGAQLPRGPRWMPWTLLGLAVVETNFTPLMTPAPYFLEGSEAAALATVMLQKNPPPSGSVAVDFSSRDVAISAGLKAVPLGPIWVGPLPDAVDAVLINSVGASGEDGGRTLQLLESAAWRVAWVVGDEDMLILEDESPTRPRWDRGWYALLLRE